MSASREDPRRLDVAEVEQLAHELGGDVAFLHAEQGLFFARRPLRPSLSPVLRLLRGIYELEPQCARWIARNRIYSTLVASPSCSGSTRVAGRQLRAGVAAVDHGLAHLAPLPRIDAGLAAPPGRRASPELEPALSRIVASAPRPAADGDWLALAVCLANEMRRQAAMREANARSDRPVAALLVDAAGDLLAWATNTGARNATSHAEVNLVEGWLQRARSPLPRGCRIFSTLKPCKMCAGLVWDAAEEPRELQVFYDEDDPLRYARETVLDAGSMARRSVARDSTDLALVLQRRLPATRSGSVALSQQR